MYTWDQDLDVIKFKCLPKSSIEKEINKSHAQFPKPWSLLSV